MKRILTVTELRRELSYSEIIECHRQTWASGSEWSAYSSTPRFADGLVLVCSEIRAVFTSADGTALTAARGDLVYVPEGERYHVRFFGGGSGTDLYTVNFRLKDRAGTSIRLGERLTLLTNGAPEDSYTLASRLADTCRAPEENFLKKQSELFAFLNAIGEELDSRSADYYPIRKGVTLLVKEWNQNHPISRYAEAAGIGETGFYRHFKAWAGVSPTEYRTRMRISAAKSLLKNSSFPVCEISTQVGFEDPYYFSRCFRKSVGLSPRAYRQSAPKPT